VEIRSDKPRRRRPCSEARHVLLRDEAGEDYRPGVKTIGADNVLRLTVVVK